MKKLLLASAAAVALCVPAMATDMPIKAPVYKAAEPIYDWSGLYVGIYSGVGAQESRGRDPTGAVPGVVEYTGAGFTGGGTIGYNWQFNRNWVVGVEGDFGHLGLSHNIQDYNDTLVYNTKTSWIGTLRGRAGYSNGPTLTYITGGGAWVHAEDSIVNGALSAANSKTLGGYTIGTGTETMLGGNWTAKAETFYVDVGHGTTLGPIAPGFVLQTDKNRYQGMKFGLNYLFGGKQQPALPAYNWSGFYAGIVGGTAVTESRGNGTPPSGAGSGSQIGNNADGFTVGGMVGYNWQFAPHWVAGVEGDFSYFGIKHSEMDYDDPTSRLGLKTSWLGTVRGRVGYSTGPALLYLTAGAAWVDLKDQWTFAGNPMASSSTTKSGGTFGGGIETVVSGNWTSKTEYLYVDAGRGNALLSGVPMQVDHTFHVFRSSLVYKFGSQ